MRSTSSLENGFPRSDFPAKKKTWPDNPANLNWIFASVMSNVAYGQYFIIQVKEIFFTFKEM